MRTARIKGDEGQGCYHCMSRIIERRMLLEREEKMKLRELMRKAETFCEVRILTHAILSNHFHILASVPYRHEVSDTELIQKLGVLYDRQVVKDVARLLKESREAGDEAQAEALKKKYTDRMFDVSQFMKIVKQRFTQWYNRRSGRKGTLWEERYKSVFVEDSEHALSTMSVYIDLNAVRAGIVSDPKDYRFCGYGEAVAGNRQAREGIRAVMLSLGAQSDWRCVSREYRKYLYMSGEAKGLGEGGVPAKPGFSVERVEQVLAQGGQLSQAELLRCRVRYLSDGVALGSRDFVESVFKKNRKSFGRKRKSGARKMRSGEWGDLHTARDLRLEVVSPPEQKT